MIFPASAQNGSDLKVAKLYGMLPAKAGDSEAGRTAANNQTVRSVFVIDPAKKIRLMLTYPIATGRNFAEILRVVDSPQLSDRHKVATPADWKKGEDVIIAASLSGEEARRSFPAGWKALKSYVRVVPQPES